MVRSFRLMFRVCHAENPVKLAVLDIYLGNSQVSTHKILLQMGFQLLHIPVSWFPRFQTGVMVDHNMKLIAKHPFRLL